jgi:hypothetical protein
LSGRTSPRFRTGLLAGAWAAFYATYFTIMGI